MEEGSLFISYSHEDKPWMLAVKKHLSGILMDRCRIWTDENIPAGTTWEERLLSNIEQAAAGLVLVSPDYLVSPWCRRELKSLSDAYKSKKLTAVYWVLLRPCGWKATELQDLQAVQEPADRAVANLPEGTLRDLEVLRYCETVAADLTRSLKDGDRALRTIRAILARSQHGAGIALMKLLYTGDFSIVGQGVDANGLGVVVKVLTNSPLRRLRDLFCKVCEARQQINVPSVVRTLHVLRDGDDYEQRIVILSEVARGEHLSAEMGRDAKVTAPSKRHFTPDTVKLLLLHLARALEAVHKLDPITWGGEGDAPYRHLVGPLSPHWIFYDPETQRPQISPVGIKNFLWHFFDPDTFQRIVGYRAGVYLLPEKSRGQKVDHRADQYFLGMLALELLEGKTLFTVADSEAPPRPLEVLANAPWAKRHEQLRKLVFKLLAEYPDKRFNDMTEAITSLDAVEESYRAVAKYSFGAYVLGVQKDASGEDFAKEFYDKLFERSERVDKIFQGVPEETQRLKLINGMKEVLNYRPGGNPSSIDTVASGHVRFNLEKYHFEAFEASFIETLRHKIQSQEDSAHLEEITEAWKRLFEPVRAEMLGYAAHQPEVEGAVSKATTHAPAAAKRAAQAGES